MSQSYYFHDQAGAIPGVLGTFAHCRVDIDEHGQATTHPLAVIDAPKEVPIAEEVAALEQEVAALEQEVAAPQQQETVVQEQEQAPAEVVEPAPDIQQEG